MTWLKITLLPAITVFVLLFAAPVMAVNILGPSCKQAPNSPVCKQAAQQGNVNPVNHTIATAVNIIAVVAGIAAVIMIMISGLRFITAGGAAPGQRSGDPSKIKSARAALTASIIGLII